jgi:hypothetical protein
VFEQLQLEPVLHYGLKRAVSLTVTQLKGLCKMKGVVPKREESGRIYKRNWVEALYDACFVAPDPTERSKHLNALVIPPSPKD